MSVSDQARARAIPLEIKKDGLQQKQNGDWVLKVVIAAADMDERLSRAPMGARFQVALVELDDDEMPKVNAFLDKRTNGRWADMGPVGQSVVRCGDPIFWAFLEEQLHFENVNSKERAAQVVREQCGVASRSHIPQRADSQAAWMMIDNAFQAWRLAEHG